MFTTILCRDILEMAMDIMVFEVAICICFACVTEALVTGTAIPCGLL